MRLRDLERAVVRSRAADAPAYLVGGAVRDRLLRRRITDVDLAVRSGEEALARRLSALGFGSAFPLSPPDSPFPVWRVASPRGTVDVARFESGGTIREDLARRDFTVNAMARAAGSPRVIDPFGGRRDLRRGVIRAISERNLRDDPLRVLRAYRIAAARGWQIDRRTRGWLEHAAPALRGTAPERMHDELVRLFGAVDPAAIAWASEDGVLSAALGLAPTGAVRRVARTLPRRRAGESPSTATVRRLALLFRAAETTPARASEILAVAKFSRAEIRDITRASRFLDAAFSDLPPFRVLYPQRDAMEEFLRTAAAAASGAGERARVRALRGAAAAARTGGAPVDGHEIAEWLGLAPGPELGRWLEAARFGWFTRRWRSREEMRSALISRRFDPENTVE